MRNFLGLRCCCKWGPSSEDPKRGSVVRPLFYDQDGFAQMALGYVGCLCFIGVVTSLAEMTSASTYDTPSGEFACSLLCPSDS